jgi:hypothetical protein
MNNLGIMLLKYAKDFFTENCNITEIKEDLHARDKLFMD